MRPVNQIKDFSENKTFKLVREGFLKTWESLLQRQFVFIHFQMKEIHTSNIIPEKHRLNQKNYIISQK